MPSVDSARELSIRDWERNSILLNETPDVPEPGVFDEDDEWTPLENAISDIADDVADRWELGVKKQMHIRLRSGLLTFEAVRRRVKAVPEITINQLLER